MRIDGVGVGFAVITGADTTIQETTFQPKRYRNYVLAFLLLIFCVNYIDRQILAILLPSIKADLALNDTQLGFLSGMAFAIFYAAMGIPMGRLSDHVNRRNLIAGVLIVWSVMTALCGLAQNFLQFLLARIGVAIGEAGCTPPSHSMLSDYFPPENRAMALSIYSSGIALGVLFGFLAGGWINEFFGWRIALLAVGLPGVLLAVLFLATVREPIRGRAEGIEDAVAVPELKVVFRHLWQRRAYRHFIAGGALTGFAYLSILNWGPSFFVRSYGLSTGEIANWMAPIMGIGGGVGALLGGRLCDSLSRRDERWYLWLPAAAALLAAPFVLLMFLVSDARLSFLSLFLPTLLFAIHYGPMSSAIQGFSPVRMRGIAVAISLFITNIFSLGLGPQAVGIISDLLSPHFGDDALRVAIPMVSIGALILATLHFCLGAKYFSADLIAPIRHSRKAA